MPFDISKNLDTLREDGVLIIENYLDESSLKKIKDETNPWLSQISFNSQISSAVIGNNQWIEHLGLCSYHALETVLDHNLINFAEQYFNEGVALGSLQYQRKVFPEPTGIPMHLDHGNGVYLFIYLNTVDDSTGATRFIKQTHKLNSIENNLQKGVTNELYIKDTFIKSHQDNFIQAHGGPGTMVIWDRKTLHDLPSFKKHGRDLIMASLIPKSDSSQIKDHLFRQSFLRKLSTKQRNVIFSGQFNENQRSLFKLGSEHSLLDEYKISRFRMFLYYIRFKMIQIFRPIKG